MINSLQTRVAQQDNEMEALQQQVNQLRTGAWDYSVEQVVKIRNLEVRIAEVRRQLAQIEARR